MNLPLSWDTVSSKDEFLEHYPVVFRASGVANLIFIQNCVKNPFQNFFLNGLKYGDVD